MLNQGMLHQGMVKLIKAC